MAPLIPVIMIAISLPLHAAPKNPTRAPAAHKKEARSANPTANLKFDPTIDEIADYASRPIDASDKAAKAPTYLLSICFSKNVFIPIDATDSRCPYRNYAAKTKLGKAVLDMAEAKEYIGALRQLALNAEHLQKVASAAIAINFKTRTDAEHASANSQNNQLVDQKKVLDGPLNKRFSLLTLRYVEMRAQAEADNSREVAVKQGRDIVLLPSPADLYAGSAP